MGNNVVMSLLTLLTDFGTSDAYVSIMKGVILTRCPEAVIVDISHEVPPGNVHTAGHVLSDAWRFFPEGTVHTIVVDPGVGSDRRILAAEVAGHFFLAPDNGVLSGVFDQAVPERVVMVENEEFYLKPTSQTFHGRDIFAPVAAAIAGGLGGEGLLKLGPPTDSWIHLPRANAVTGPGGAIAGEVTHVDRFGNIITNISGDDLPREMETSIGRHVIRGRQTSYVAGQSDEVIALIGSTGHLELSINHGSAAEFLGVTIGDQVGVIPKVEGGDA